MKISELAQRTGVPKTTIHFYQRENLLPPAFSTSRTTAFYGVEHVRRLEEIRQLREKKLLSISEIKAMFSKKTKAKPPSEARKRGDFTRQLIVEAAIEEFSSKGYRKTKVTDIIARARISNMTFYRYFFGKRDLFLALVERIISEVVMTTEKQLKGEKDFIKRMTVRAKGFYDIYSHNREILHILLGESVGEDKELRALATKIYNFFTDALAEDIKVLQSKDALPNFDAEVAAYALVGLTQLVCYRWSIDNKYTLEDFLKYTILTLMGIRQIKGIDFQKAPEYYSDFISKLAAQ